MASTLYDYYFSCYPTSSTLYCRKASIIIMCGFPFVSEVFFFRESYELINVEDHASYCRMAREIIVMCHDTRIYTNQHVFTGHSMYVGPKSPSPPRVGGLHYCSPVEYRAAGGAFEATYHGRRSTHRTKKKKEQKNKKRRNVKRRQESGDLL